MRKTRLIEHCRCYHLVSRLAHRAFFLDDEEKTRAVGLLRRVEEFDDASVYDIFWGNPPYYLWRNPYWALRLTKDDRELNECIKGISSEYADDELGLVYYNYRHYDPAMGRWLQRDPIEEVSGIRLYGYTGNGMQVDFLGLWEALDSGNARRKYKRYLGDTNSELADEVGLDVGEFEVWARLIDPDECIYSVPNVWIDADLLQGPAELYDHVINIGGTLGSFALTDIGVWGKKIVKVDDIASLQAALAGSVGDLWGIQVFAHGDSSGTFVVMPGKDRRFIEQNEIMSYVSGGGYKIAYAYMMQCYSAAGEYGDRWRDLAIHFIGYDGMNVLGFDMEGDYWPWNWFD